jgi:uncharacterized membrane protein
MGAGGWFLMVLIGAVLLGLLAAFIVWFVQDQRRRPHRDHHLHAGSASEILDRRLAIGEIGIPEYERLKATLASAAHGRTPSSEPPDAPQA